MMIRLRLSLALALVAAALCASQADDLLRRAPRYDRFIEYQRDSFGAVKRGDVSPVRWATDGSAFSFRRDGKSYKFDLKSKAETEGEIQATSTSTSGGRGNPARGRQFSSTNSPDGKLKATYKDGNVFLSAPDGSSEKQVSLDGNLAKRIKYGSASWVYGEELSVREAMWWSPDSTILAFYRFDESKVQDYHLAMDQLEMQTKLDAEAYPKPGRDNPGVEIVAYDVASGKSTTIDTKFTSEAGPFEYVYNVRWSPDGKELLYLRANRKQNTIEFCAADPKTGKSRMIIRESAKTWVDTSPEILWLDEKRSGPERFLWHSERNGYYNWYLYDLSGKLYNAVTSGLFEAGPIQRVDLSKNVMFYTAHSAPNPYRNQLHRVKLDGTGDTRLTNPEFNHTVSVAPDGKFFVDVAETLDTPPTSTLRDAEGKEIKTLATSDTSKFDSLKLQKVERLEFKSADGSYMLYGELHKPSDFDPNKKYPLLIETYAGPESGGGAERFQTPNSLTELGFLVASFDGRGTSGRGKAFRESVYGKLGIVEIDDQAAGAKALLKQPYVDPARVGIFGTSYGGYTSVMAILRYPDIFAAAVASSPVTDWRNYDTIYTERYMGLPFENENKKGYDDGSAMQYASNLKGRLFLYYGTADNNVHPSNTYQLVRALRAAGKRFEVMPGPDQGHSFVGTVPMLEYFLDAFQMAK